MRPLAATTGSSHARPAALVLVVDDEPDMVENVARILRRGAFACLTAGSAREALALVERDRPDLILTDLRMPGMDGLALFRAVKRLSPPTPVIIVTACASDAIAEEALAAGVTAFLAKPFSAAELRQMVREGMAGSGGRQPTVAAELTRNAGRRSD